MKIAWEKSALWTSELEYDKEFIKSQELYLQSRLIEYGFLFLNSALDALGFDFIKRGQFDGWLWDENDPAGQLPIKIKLKTENGKLYLVFNEEKNIIDHAFME